MRTLETHSAILIGVLLVALMITPALATEGWRQRDGWTEVPTSENGIQIFVSSSTGSDENNGRTPGAPVATLAKAKALLRDGRPDQMLLKRGDVWEEAIGEWTQRGGFVLGGRSAREPMLIGTYGDLIEPRPLLKIGAEDGLVFWSSETDEASHIAVVGLHFYAHTRDPGCAEYVGKAGGDGIHSISDGRNILIEDCLFEFCGVSVAPYQKNDDDARFTDFTIRRCAIINNYAENGHSQGLFITETDRIRIEECFFDHNGWLVDTPASRTRFNHNVYVTTYCTDLAARGNIFLRGSASGLQARPGGDVTDNVFVNNAAQLNWGYFEGDATPPEGGVTGSVKRNVFLDAVPEYQTGAMWAVCFGHVRSGDVRRNLAWNSGSFHFSAEDEDGRIGINHLTIQHNAIYSPRLPAFRFFRTAYNAVKVTRNLIVSPKGAVFDRDGALGQGLSCVSLRRNLVRSDLPHEQAWTPIHVVDIARWEGETESLDGFSRLQKRQRQGAWNGVLSGYQISAMIREHAFRALHIPE